MKQSSKTASLIVSFVFFGASLASANNFSKNVVDKAEPVVEKVEAAAEVEAPVKTQIPVKVEVQAEAKALPKAQLPAKVVVVAAPARTGAPGQPYEVQTPERTMIICPDGYACAEEEGTVKCLADKTAPVKPQGGVLCKSIPKSVPPSHKK
mgnify:CR=1 FL=1